MDLSTPPINTNTHLYRWDQKDKEYLQSNFESQDNLPSIAYHLNRPKNEVYEMACFLGLIHRPWTEDENTYLQKHYHGTKVPDLMYALARSENSIRGQLQRLKLVKQKRLTQDQLHELIADYPSMKSADLSEKYGISQGRISQLAKKYGLSKNRPTVPLPPLSAKQYARLSTLARKEGRTPQDMLSHMIDSYSSPYHEEEN